MTAVAVWSEKPSAQSMLDARLERGWSPTATEMVGGGKVLGYAACAVEPR